MIKTGTGERMRELCCVETLQGGSLRAILPVYAGKDGMLTAVLQYVYQAIRLGGSGSAEEGRAIETIAGEKLRDFEVLGALIAQLGADPVFTACPPYPVSYHSAAGVDYAKTYPEMLLADIRLEERLIARFEEIGRQFGACTAGETVARLRLSACSHLERLRKMLSSCGKK